MRHPLLWIALAGSIGICAGCGADGPKTHPVKGRVVPAKAEDLKMFVGQAVELQSTAESETRGFGKIQADGSFTISTYRQGKSLPGAMEGTHKVRLMIDLGDDEDGRPRKKKWALDRKYTQFDESGWVISVPSDGELILKLR